MYKIMNVHVSHSYVNVGNLFKITSKSKWKWKKNQIQLMLPKFDEQNITNEYRYL